MVFCHAYAFSVGVIKSSLDEFAKVSGLVTNLEKIQLFLSGVSGEVQLRFNQSWGFSLFGI